jgi:adenylate kinase family enzyme
MILMLGTPGAGKTTQTKLLAEYLNVLGFLWEN